MVAIVCVVFLEVYPVLKHANAMAESILLVVYLNFESNTSGNVAGGVPSCHKKDSDSCFCM